jgi:hypothetical protein
MKNEISPPFGGLFFCIPHEKFIYLHIRMFQKLKLVMKKLLLALLVGLIATFAGLSAQSVIFLHHSTGGAVYSHGDVPEYFEQYNQTNGTSYTITERGYPNSPYPWANYPYDYWHLWVDGNCDSDESGIECLNTLAAEYEVVIWKHCYPGAAIKADNGTPDISSNRKSLENYKLQYEALKTEMSKYPDTKFIVWTLAPLHSLSTNADDAARAMEFVDWVNNDWLSENPGNIYIFDFYSLTAELSENPAEGQTGCLKYEYEKSHDSGDSHPNPTANLTIGPIFAQRIIDVIEETGSSIPEDVEIKLIHPNPAGDTIDFGSEEIIKAEIINCAGISQIVSTDSSIDVSNLIPGVYFVKIESGSGVKYGKFIKK